MSGAENAYASSVEQLYTSIPVDADAPAADERVETLVDLVDAVVESERIRCAAVCCRCARSTAAADASIEPQRRTEGVLPS